MTQEKQEIRTISENDQIALIELLIRLYKRTFPWQDKPEHKNSRGFSSPAFFKDVQAYSQAITDWVIENAKTEGVAAHAYRMIKATFENSSWSYVLLRDGSPISEPRQYLEYYDYALRHLQDVDLYCEPGTIIPITGFELRQSRNDQEDYYYSKDGSYTPEYIHAPSK